MTNKKEVVIRSNGKDFSLGVVTSDNSVFALVDGEFDTIHHISEMADLKILGIMSEGKFRELSRWKGGFTSSITIQSKIVVPLLEETRNGKLLVKTDDLNNMKNDLVNVLTKYKIPKSDYSSVLGLMIQKLLTPEPIQEGKRIAWHEKPKMDEESKKDINLVLVDLSDSKDNLKKFLRESRKANCIPIDFVQKFNALLNKEAQREELNKTDWRTSDFYSDDKSTEMAHTFLNIASRYILKETPSEVVDLENGSLFLANRHFTVYEKEDVNMETHKHMMLYCGIGAEITHEQYLRLQFHGMDYPSAVHVGVIHGSKDGPFKFYLVSKNNKYVDDMCRYLTLISKYFTSDEKTQNSLIPILKTKLGDLTSLFQKTYKINPLA